MLLFLSADLLPLLLFSLCCFFLYSSLPLVSSFCHSFFCIFLPSFTAYFNLSFCSNPLHGITLLFFDTKLMRDIKYRGQAIDTFVAVQVRCKALCIPVHYKQNTDVHDTSGITKGGTQLPSGNELRPGSFCPSFSTLPFLKTK